MLFSQYLCSPTTTPSLAARHNLTVSLARELKDSGVTANTVAPGAILIDATRDFILKLAPNYQWGNSWEEMEKGAVREFVPNDIGRFGRPEEIAGAVAYLTSPYADYISGSVIRVDGGTIKCT